MRIHAGEELHGRELRCETLSVHQALDHTHDCCFKISDADFSEDLFNTVGGFISHCDFLTGAEFLQRAENMLGVLRAASVFKL